jgi:hypothetical protein
MQSSGISRYSSQCIDWQVTATTVRMCRRPRVISQRRRRASIGPLPPPCPHPATTNSSRHTCCCYRCSSLHKTAGAVVVSSYVYPPCASQTPACPDSVLCLVVLRAETSAWPGGAECHVRGQGEETGTHQGDAVAGAGDSAPFLFVRDLFPQNRLKMCWLF